MRLAKVCAELSIPILCSANVLARSQPETVGYLWCRGRVAAVIPCHPHSAEMAPAELLHHDISVRENIAELQHINAAMESRNAQ